MKQVAIVRLHAWLHALELNINWQQAEKTPKPQPLAIIPPPSFQALASSYIQDTYQIVFNMFPNLPYEGSSLFMFMFMFMCVCVCVFVSDRV